jgi:hypothetical protein
LTNLPPRFQSASAVLQMVLYLDPNHTEWMSDEVLERVINALRGRITVKLEKEHSATKVGSQVDVYRGGKHEEEPFQSSRVEY